jgi:methylglutaconyl-CoA hydratase
MTEFSTLKIEQDGPVRRILLNRPQVHNAFNGTVVSELTAAFGAAGDDPGTRVVVLAGIGPSFSAGADLTWMGEQSRLPPADNQANAEAMARMFLAVARCPKVVLGRIHGAALGGGSGLTAAVDIAIASEDARFGFTEARLGIIPSVISPFVVERIGSGRARVLFLTGMRFDAREAERIGLVHRCVESDQLNVVAEQLIKEVLACGPDAVRECKELLRCVQGCPLEDAIPYTSATIARIRATPEAQEGMSAFLEKRKPNW